jgi:N utilization substance protein A
MVQRREGRIVLVDLGRTAGILKPEDQVETERYVPGERLKVYVRQVALGSRGPEILLSRTADELVREMFITEIPEVAEGAVEIKALAREAGARSKVAVAAVDPNLDPIGACIGQRGTRIQTVISALGGEKIDLIEWNENPEIFIAHAIAPAKTTEIKLDETERTAFLKVAADQLSLAIGRGGQNVRLAARLTGWKINVNEDGKVAQIPEAENNEEGEVGESAVVQIDGGVTNEIAKEEENAETPEESEK